MNDRDKPAAGIEGVAGHFTYWTSMLGIYLLFGTLFFYSGKEKTFDGLGMPDGLKKQFEGTFLETVPGLDASWTILGIFELAIFALTVISVLTGEFLPNKRKPVLFAALGLSVLTFAMLAVGDNLTGEHEGVASLFLYAAGTAVFMLLLRHLPPYGRLFEDD